jgi:hypothetical protein
MSIHVELKEIPGRRIPTVVVTNGKGGLRWEIGVSYSGMVQELMDTLQGLI